MRVGTGERVATDRATSQERQAPFEMAFRPLWDSHHVCFRVMADTDATARLPQGNSYIPGRRLSRTLKEPRFISQRMHQQLAVPGRIRRGQPETPTSEASKTVAGIQ